MPAFPPLPLLVWALCTKRCNDSSERNVSTEEHLQRREQQLLMVYGLPPSPSPCLCCLKPLYDIRDREPSVLLLALINGVGFGLTRCAVLSVQSVQLWQRGMVVLFFLLGLFCLLLFCRVVLCCDSGLVCSCFLVFALFVAFSLFISLSLSLLLGGCAAQ